jgi:hypothetical protein
VGVGVGVALPSATESFINPATLQSSLGSLFDLYTARHFCLSTACISTA